MMIYYWHEILGIYWWCIFSDWWNCSVCEGLWVMRHFSVVVSVCLSFQMKGDQLIPIVSTRRQATSGSTHSWLHPGVIDDTIPWSRMFLRDSYTLYHKPGCTSVEWCVVWSVDDLFSFYSRVQYICNLGVVFWASRFVKMFLPSVDLYIFSSVSSMNVEIVE